MSMYVREDWTLFRSLDTICQQAGVPKYRVSSLVAKELMDNALDSAKTTCKIGRLSNSGFFVQDDGEGINPERLSEFFSINRPMMSSKLIRLPTKGRLGNGLRVVSGVVIATGGSLVVSTKGRTYEVEPQYDGTALVKDIGTYDKPGMRIEIHLGRSAGNVNLSWAERAVNLTDGETYKGKTSPFWYTSEAFYELTQADATGRSVRDVAAEDFDGCSGRAGEIASVFKGRQINSLTHDESDDLLELMRETAKAVKPARLGLVGKTEGLPSNYAKTSGTFSLVSDHGINRPQAEIPFVVEAWVELSEESSILGHVNRTPICYDFNATHNKKTVDLWGCGLNREFPVGQKPMLIWFNVITPFIEITSNSKEPDFTLMRDQIYDVIQKAINRAKRNAPEHAIDGETNSKTKSAKEVVLSNMKYAIEKASGGGEYRFAQRQLYYVIRPFVKEATGKELRYKNFETIITDYEAENGDIKGIYRDPRGIVHIPHLNQDIPLGTLSVEEYKRPEWVFNKILFIEKEGFFEALKGVKWPERNDCALMTSKGQPTRAARDLLDLLSKEGEEITIFAIHDADCAGSIIYQTLQEGTRARPGLKVEVINLGLEAWEAIELMLEVEDTEYTDRKAVAEYVPKEWHDWLQKHRIELNAFTTKQFIDWLDAKMALHGARKLIPPDEVLIDRLKTDIQHVLRDSITERILMEANIDQLTEDAYTALEPEINEQAAQIRDNVTTSLHERPERHWSAPVKSLSERLIEI